MRALSALLILLCVVATGSAEPTFRELNETFGHPVWMDDSLWDDPHAEVAARLELNLESQTTTERSYRSYRQGDRKLLGAGYYSLAMYAVTNRLTQISIMFLNKGDYTGMTPAAASDAEAWREWQRQRDKKLRGYSSAWRKTRDEIESRLDKLLGASQRDRFGATAAASETVRRWDWNGHAILLAAPQSEYIHVRIVPSAVADAGGRIEKIRDKELREQLAKRVQRRPNGDVIVTDIPMVNQGPKGYCVPATWERYLRYLGIPVDMYWLAVIAETGPGGGTYLQNIVDGARGLVNQGGRRLNRISASVSLDRVREYVDKGLPLMWTTHLVGELNYELTRRAHDRLEVTNMETWKKKLEEHRRPRKLYRLEKHRPAHQCLIIGYNVNTRELATSDSWGPDFAERWLTLEEADFIDLNECYVIMW
ncbi:MAG: C39 family peptidase [Verrucomicrobiae bacterium]|nr:C39 family peptidase [Verrucomicrobiae bacterium]